jgi:ubiquinone/menaquinone biosynthesis C-methylase UbiE
MKLNKLEFLAMNNWIRAIIQEKYEVKILRRLSKLDEIEIALEIGCGNGAGAHLIEKYFNPSKLIGVDIDEEMIKRAIEGHQDNDSMEFKVNDASKLGFPDHYFDAIFCFGAIHHIPNWRDCIYEMKRVLKPGGEIILEDLSIDSFASGIGKLWRKLFAHPYAEMYTSEDFKKHLIDVGFNNLSYEDFYPLKLIKHFSLSANS